jgi:hypothetical protein
MTVGCSDLQRVFLGHGHRVSLQIPQAWVRKTGLALLHTCVQGIPAVSRALNENMLALVRKVLIVVVLVDFQVQVAVVLPVISLTFLTQSWISCSSFLDSLVYEPTP